MHSECEMESLNDIKKIIEDEELFGVMNNSRWQAVYKIFSESDQPFQFKSKIIDGEVFPEDHLRFDSREVFPKHFSSILWLEVHTKDKNTDCTAEAIETAIRAKARFTLTEYGLKILGYTKLGDNIEFYNQT